MSDQANPPSSGAPSTTEQVSLVTVSYRGDLELAAELCRSVDRFLDKRAEHVLVVPRSDASIFSQFKNDQRRIVVMEDVLPAGYRKLPSPRQIRIGSLYRKRLREMWLTPTGIVRGWIIQQIVKLSAPSYTRNDIIVFADSDIVLTAPLTAKDLQCEGRTRLYRVPDATSDSPMHIGWHVVSARLLGIPESGYMGADYIGNLITWSRPNVELLQERLSSLSGKRWDKVIARQAAFSEYILYGIFVDHILDPDASGQFATKDDLVHAGWFFDLTTAAGLEEFTRSVKASHVAVAIQSTEPFSLEERRALVRKIEEQSIR